MLSTDILGLPLPLNQLLSCSQRTMQCLPHVEEISSIFYQLHSFQYISLCCPDSKLRYRICCLSCAYEVLLSIFLTTLVSQRRLALQNGRHLDGALAIWRRIQRPFTIGLKVMVEIAFLVRGLLHKRSSLLPRIRNNTVIFFFRKLFNSAQTSWYRRGTNERT